MARLARLASPRQPKGESASVALARAESAASAASEKYEALSKTMRENSCEWEARYHALAKSIRDRNERFLPSSASQTDWDGSSIDGAIGEAKKWKAECETLAAELKRLSAAAAESEARRKAAQEALREAEKKLDEEMQRRREAERAERAARRAFEDLESSEADARRELATAQHAAEREMAVAKHAIELSQVEVAEARREATRAAASAARVAAQARDDAMGRAHTRMVSPRRVAAKFEARRATAQEQFQRLVEHAEHSRELATAMVRPSTRAPHPDSTITYPGRLPSLTLGVASIRTIPWPCLLHSQRRQETHCVVGVLESYVVATTSRAHQAYALATATTPPIADYDGSPDHDQPSTPGRRGQQRQRHSSPSVDHPCQERDGSQRGFDRGTPGSTARAFTAAGSTPEAMIASLD